MPELKCTVQTCLHNKNFCCDLDNIIVGGESARNASGTSCKSFEERKGHSCGNVIGEATPTSQIDCKARECCYNDNCRCNAGKISMEGSNACRCEQTECATFKCQCK